MRRLTLALCLIFWLPTLANAQSLQDKWQSLYQLSWQASPIFVSQQELSHYPKALLQDNSRYPNFKKFTWQDIALLAEIQQTCQAIEPSNSALNDAIEFELALCRQQTLDSIWFAAHSKRHPAGGSFADRYFAHYPENREPIHPFLTISNPLHPLYTKLEPLSPEGKEALLNGYRAWQQGDVLWLSGEQGWKVVPHDVWKPIAKEQGITLSGESCSFRYSNLCLSETNNDTLFMKMMIFSLLIVLFSILARSLFLRTKQRKERQFVLQLLTHELRTPITSLGLTVEMFRNRYDEFPDATQDAVWRLISDYQRLSQLTENSKVYLSTENAEPLLKQNASLEEWLEHVCEKHNIDYQCDSGEVELNLPYYWLTICLDNLIKNAKQHGKGNVFVTVTLADKLRVEVQDQGHFPSFLERALSRVTPNDAHRHDNMGIGLTIVEHLMKQANGRLIILRNPTRCILEIAYEHPTAD
ncbi:Histidine kinase [Vibrio chagasii]|nr:Histidine kinase [Vibrio chagasii]CAH7123157.1 Histidine kinase [Vibrio chagasii]CAH7175199.1 Histidine kinase [Vibrio chagasii]CAH7444900.1 Histidine kinase [Vibrio chagasii]